MFENTKVLFHGSTDLLRYSIIDNRIDKFISIGHQRANFVGFTFFHLSNAAKQHNTWTGEYLKTPGTAAFRLVDNFKIWAPTGGCIVSMFITGTREYLNSQANTCRNKQVNGNWFAHHTQTLLKN